MPFFVLPRARRCCRIAAAAGRTQFTSLGGGGGSVGPNCFSAVLIYRRRPRSGLRKSLTAISAAAAFVIQGVDWRFGRSCVTSALCAAGENVDSPCVQTHDPILLIQPFLRKKNRNRCKYREYGDKCLVIFKSHSSFFTRF